MDTQHSILYVMYHIPQSKFDMFRTHTVHYNIMQYQYYASLRPWGGFFVLQIKLLSWKMHVRVSDFTYPDHRKYTLCGIVILYKRTVNLSVNYSLYHSLNKRTTKPILYIKMAFKVSIKFWELNFIVRIKFAIAFWIKFGEISEKKLKTKSLLLLCDNLLT